MEKIINNDFLETCSTCKHTPDKKFCELRDELINENDYCFMWSK